MNEDVFEVIQCPVCGTKEKIPWGSFNTETSEFYKVLEKHHYVAEPACRRCNVIASSEIVFEENKAWAEVRRRIGD